MTVTDHVAHRAASFTMVGPDGRLHPWLLLTRPDGSQVACHFDDALTAMIDGQWRSGALHEVTDAMRAAAVEVLP